MSLASDLTLNCNKFRGDSIRHSTVKINGHLESLPTNEIKWYEVGAPYYREMKTLGKMGFPKLQAHANASDIEINSRQRDRMIPCRLIKPGTSKYNSIYMHMHAGGWVYNTHQSQDCYLAHIAETTGVLIVSVGYRLAPENPYPSGPEDCCDVAEWLLDNGPSNLGASLQFLGGESAGAHLALLTTIHLLNSRPAFAASGLVLNCGVYDLSLLPQVHTFKRKKLVLDGEDMKRFTEAFLPNSSVKERKDPSVSPLYIDFDGIKLPPALITCGTEDCLLDDTFFLSMKWQRTGAETILQIYPGGCHAFQLLQPAHDELATTAAGDLCTFIKQREKAV